MMRRSLLNRCLSLFAVPFIQRTGKAVETARRLARLHRHWDKEITSTEWLSADDAASLMGESVADMRVMFGRVRIVRGIPEPSWLTTAVNNEICDQSPSPEPSKPVVLE